MADDKEFGNIVRSYLDYFKSSNFMGGFKVSSTNNRNLVRYGADIRDRQLHRYSILPGAIQTFISIATSREWQVLGTPRTASRTLDMLHGSSFRDADGIIHYGFEELISRMCMDWLCIGRAAFRSTPNIPSERLVGWSPFEYIDVAELRIMTDQNQSFWQYKDPFDRSDLRKIDQEELFFMDNIRIGAGGGTLGTVAWLIPVAHLDWLLREHDSMQLDGRKIRDVLVVMDGMKDEIQEAVTISMALSSGEDPSKWGVPVIEVNPGGYDGPMSDYFARIGLSDLPREFSREEFETRYAREISSTLGLPIGQFWHDPRGTNRSLEQVTQERSTLKGPAYFIRSFERLVNNSPVTGTRMENRSILQFQEETDNSSLLQSAQALESYAKAISALKTAFKSPEQIQEEQQQFQPNQDNGEEENEEQRSTVLRAKETLGDEKMWLSFLQTKGLVPPNTTMSELIIMEEQSLKRTVEEDSTDVMDRGWVRLDQNGMVLERRSDFMISV